MFCANFPHKFKFKGKKMLLEFKVSNFRSIAEEQTFSMLPSINNSRAFSTDNNFHKKALKVGAIYGPNGAGKTNFVKAIECLKSLLRDSGKFNSSDKLHIENHVLSEGLANEPTTFDITFTAWGDVWSYYIALHNDKVSAERLTKRNKSPRSQERPIFDRSVEFNHEDLNTYANIMWKQTNPNQLILSKLDQNNDQVTKNAYKWLVYFLRTIRKLEDFPKGPTIDYLLDSSTSKVVLAFLHAANIGVEKFNVSEIEIDPQGEQFKVIKQLLELQGMPKLPDDGHFKSYDIEFLHKSRGKALIPIDLEEESLGTRNLFALTAPILDTLQKGYTLIIDELNQSFHTELQKYILNYFIQNETNPNRAQLIFTTHDTNIMNELERDEIWLCEKHDNGASEYYTLSDLGTIREGGPRKNDAFEKHYLEGRYGGLPDIDHIQSIRNTKKWLENEEL